MALVPTNEKLLMVEGDDEAWVDTHHGIGRSHDMSHDLSERSCDVNYYSS